MKVLAMYGSPRKEGNTTLLLQALVKGLHAQGGAATEIFLCDLQILPCVADHSCSQSGECFLQDDMRIIYSHLVTHDCIVLAAPIFFYSVNAQTKALIDRSQALWARKYVLKLPVGAAEIKKKGIFISVGATKGAKLFDGTLLTVKYFFDTINAELSHALLHRSIDGAGEILKHPDALQEAYNLGRSLAASEGIV
jgi:multimeric flavodoxin WrbA